MSQGPSDKDDGLRAEYDFTGGTRGKHHEAYRAGRNVVFLDADVAAGCPDSASVNRARRAAERLPGRSSGLGPVS